MNLIKSIKDYFTKLNSDAPVLPKYIIVSNGTNFIIKRLIEGSTEYEAVPDHRGGTKPYIYDTDREAEWDVERLIENDNKSKPHTIVVKEYFTKEQKKQKETELMNVKLRKALDLHKEGKHKEADAIFEQLEKEYKL